ncbi:MAG: hypothetical protein AAGD13_04040 [Pseudomonadota bacterium]
MSLLIASLRERADAVRVQAVTGRFDDVTRELDGNVDGLMQIEKSISDLQTYNEAIALSEARANVTQSALEQMRNVAQSLADTVDLLRTNGTTRDFEAVSATAREDLGSVVSGINAQFAGRPLFSGDDGSGSAITDSATIQTLGVPFLEAQPDAATAYANIMSEFVNPGTTFDTSIYQGGAGDAPQSEVGPGERVDYAVKATEDPLRSILANVVALGAAFDTTNGIPDAQRRQIVEMASEGLRSDISNIIAIQSRVGSAEERIANVKARNAASEASLTIAFNNLAGVDQVESTLELTELERQLETAFATTARLSNLSLVNFL